MLLTLIIPSAALCGSALSGHPSRPSALRLLNLQVNAKDAEAARWEAARFAKERKGKEGFSNHL